MTRPISLLTLGLVCNVAPAGSTEREPGLRDSTQTITSIELELYTSINDQVPPYDFSVMVKIERESKASELEDFSVRLDFAEDAVVGDAYGCLNLRSSAWRRMGEREYIRFLSSNARNADLSARILDTSAAHTLRWFTGLDCHAPIERSIEGWPISARTNRLIPNTAATDEQADCKPSDFERIFRVNDAPLTILPSPSDQTPPYDFRIGYTLQADQGCLGHWRSTSIAITSELPPVGGTRACTESPLPDIDLNELHAIRHHLNFTSGNQYTNDVDYRLPIGTYQFAMTAFSKPTCKGKPIAEIVSEPITFDGMSNP